MDQKDLKQKGLKVTQPRVQILELFSKNPHLHLTAEEVYQRLVKQKVQVGIATVYRVLGQFEIAGILIKHRFSNEHSVYELNEGKHHDHLVCVKCGKVVEFVDDVIEKRQHNIAKSHQFEMTDHVLTIYGVCSDCVSDK